MSASCFDLDCYLDAPAFGASLQRQVCPFREIGNVGEVLRRSQAQYRIRIMTRGNLLFLANETSDQFVCKKL